MNKLQWNFYRNSDNSFHEKFVIFKLIPRIHTLRITSEIALRCISGQTKGIIGLSTMHYMTLADKNQNDCLIHWFSLWYLNDNDCFPLQDKNYPHNRSNTMQSNMAMFLWNIHNRYGIFLVKNLVYGSFVIAVSWIMKKQNDKQKHEI